MKRPPIHSLLAVATLAAAWATSGCGAKYERVTFTSRADAGQLEQGFALVAAARDARGDYDVVLVSQGLEDAAAASGRRDLTPVAAAPVRQVLHLKLHWRPPRGATANNPAAANATARWVIMGTGGAADLLEYQGTAFVRPIFEREGYTLLIREGSLEKVLLRGEMVDVLGPTRFEGKVYAREDPATVAGILAELPPPTLTPLPPPATRQARITPTPTPTPTTQAAP
jgi:hypothetical protein